MKTLGKLMVLVLALTVVTGAFAQTYCIKAGLNLANMLMENKNDTYSDDFKMKLGYHAGATVEFPIVSVLSFEAGLLASTKGFKETDEWTIGGYKTEYERDVSLMYLDIPITGKATFDVGDVNFYAVFGPYLGIGLSGKIKTEETRSGETEKEEEDIEWGSDEEESDIKRLDYGLTMGAGVEFGMIQIGLTYNYGLANLSPYTEDDTKMANRVIGISAGFEFSEK